MPKFADGRLYTVALHLTHAEALQDALAGAMRAASLEVDHWRAEQLKHLPVPAGDDGAYQGAAASYAYAVKQRDALAELMAAVGRHI